MQPNSMDTAESKTMHCFRSLQPHTVEKQEQSRKFKINIFLIECLRVNLNLLDVPRSIKLDQMLRMQRQPPHWRNIDAKLW